MRGVSPIPGFLYFLGSSSSLSQVHLCFDSQNTQYILNEIPSRVVSPAGSLSASLPGCVLALSVALPHTLPLSLSLSLSLMLSTSRSFPPPLSIALAHSLPLSLSSYLRPFLPTWRVLATSRTTHDKPMLWACHFFWSQNKHEASANSTRIQATVVPCSTVESAVSPSACMSRRPPAPVIVSQS